MYIYCDRKSINCVMKNDEIFIVIYDEKSTINTNNYLNFRFGGFRISKSESDDHESSSNVIAG